MQCLYLVLMIVVIQESSELNPDILRYDDWIKDAEATVKRIKTSAKRRAEYGINKDTYIHDKRETDTERRKAEKEKEDLLYEQKKELFAAAKNNDLKTIKSLVEEKNVPLKCYDMDVQTVAVIAAKNGHLDIVKYVGDKNPKMLDYRDRWGNTVLHLANEEHVMEIIKYLEDKFKAGTLPWKRSDFESMAIHAASQFGHWKVLNYFFDQLNTNVDAIDDKGDPSIFTAVRYRHDDVFKYLVEKKAANITMLNENKDNVLYVAVEVDNLPIMRYILDERKAPIDVNWQNSFKNTIVHRAVIQNRPEILKYLVEEKHADVNVLGYENRTALSHGSSNNFYDICKYLIEHGADPLLRDKFGYYPAQRAYNEQLDQYLRNVTWGRSRRSINSWQSVQEVFGEKSILSGNIVESYS